MPHASSLTRRCCHRVCPGSAGGAALALILLLLLPSIASAAISGNQLHRIEVRQRPEFTRITLKLQDNPHYTVTSLSNNRLRVRLHDTSGRIFRNLRRYSDRNIGGLVVARRGNDLVMTLAMAAKGVGWRAVHSDGIPALSLDVGPFLEAPLPRPSQPGRERIWDGAEKLLRDFDPPIKPEAPFLPTDRQVLKNLLSDEDQKLFLAAESALYKGQLTAAEDALVPFADRTGSAIRPLALYRLAETRYRLQRYSQALENFRQAQQLWPEFLSFNPASMFYYGDSIARSGDLPGGRQLLKRLVVENADKKYAPVLLVRMADVLARQGHEPEAQAIYRTVVEAFDDSKARQIARMKLADRAFLKASPLDYLSLTTTYREIAEHAGDFDLREEATFKAMLLAAINAPAKSALDEAISFHKRFPKGVYVTLVRDIREDLVGQSFQQERWERDPAGLLAMVNANQEFLAVALRLPDFLPAVTSAFEKAGRPLDLIVLYVGLTDRPWVDESNLPYLYLTVAEQSELLGDTLLAKKMLRSFLTRFPVDPLARIGRERLAALQFLDNELDEARLNLLWLLNKGEHASLPVSYYYLGRALWQNKSFAQAALAMDLYLASSTVGNRGTPTLAGDAYYIGAQSRQALGQYALALAQLETGLKAVPPERRDQFLYKLGEVSLQAGRAAQARTFFEQLVKEGKDADWRRLAAQSLQFMPPPPPASVK